MAENEPILGQTIWDKVTNAKEFFTQTRLYEAIELHFSKIGHTHTISNISNLQSTLNRKSDGDHDHDDRYYTKSQIDSKYSDGNYVLKHTQTSGNLTVNLYSNGVDVYVECNSNENNITVNANQSTQLMTLTCSSDYFPRNNMYSAMMRGTTSSPRLRLTTGGSIYVYNSSSTTSFDCDCGIMYPLKSRFP